MLIPTAFVRELELATATKHHMADYNGTRSPDHDAAFDAGLITLDEKFRVVLSKQLKSHLPQTALKNSFGAYEGKAIRLPKKLAEPSQEFLE